MPKAKPDPTVPVSTLTSLTRASGLMLGLARDFDQNDPASWTPEDFQRIANQLFATSRLMQQISDDARDSQ